MCFSTMSTLMSTSLRRGCCLISAAALITLLTLTQRPLAASDDATEVNSLAQYYGFSGMELFRWIAARSILCPATLPEMV